MTKMFSLENRVALVTGASRGLGLAMARALKENGAHVIINARDAAALSTAATSIGAQPLAFDVSDAAVSRKALEGIVQEHGHLDILVNNAGIHRAAPFLDYSPQDFRDLFEVNFISVVHTTQCVLPAMIARKSGSIVMLASTAGKWGTPNQSAYNVSKHAVIGLTRCLALEVAPHQVRVNAICPWIVDTDMATSFIAEHAKVAGLTAEQTAANFVNSVPLKRYVRPDEVAQLAVFLGSEEASYVNGQSWAIDGGRTMI